MTQWMEETDVVYGAWRLQLRVDSVVHRRHSDHHDIIVFDNALFGRVLVLDGLVQVTERDAFVYHEMLAHVPIFAHGAVRRVLIIGGGDGAAAREVLRHRSVEQVTIVEIDPDVVEACREHLGSVSEGVFDDPRTRVVYGDGVDFVASTRERFDVVLMDSSDPVGAGAAFVERPVLRNCRRRLEEGGALVTLHGVPFAEPEWLGRPFAWLRDVFAHAACYLAPVPSFFGGTTAFTIASDEPAICSPSPEVLEQRFASAGIETRYYTPAVHRAAFALPPYISRIVS